MPCWWMPLRLDLNRQQQQKPVIDHETVLLSAFMGQQTGRSDKMYIHPPKLGLAADAQKG